MEEIMQWASASKQNKEKMINLAGKRKADHDNKYGSF